MAAQTLTLAGKKFVVIPQSEYRQLKTRAGRGGKSTKTKRRPSKQERGDIAQSLRNLAEPGRLTLDELTQKLGWDPARLRK
jgi:hypothetical protein